VVLSIKRREDGEIENVMLSSVNGKTGNDLGDDELFVLWLSYAKVLVDTCPRLSPGARKFVEAIRKATAAFVEGKMTV
jgi:hypothetical protein